jgi:RNA 2',3'-cyclic 3'-phosphodiesterase
MRLFAAIELPRAATDAVAAEGRRLAREAREATDAVRWVRPEHMHLTLVFLGELPDALGMQAMAAFGAPLERAAFPVEIRGVGVFPPVGRPRTLWLGVGDGVRAVVETRAALAARLTAAGVMTPQEAAFHPHVTLGRWKQSRSRDRVDVLAAGRGASIATFDVDDVVLVRSRLSSEGPSHAIVARCALEGRATG